MVDAVFRGRGGAERRWNEGTRRETEEDGGMKRGR